MKKISQHPYVPPSGPEDAALFLIGEAPGAEEAARGEPFVGQSGKELTKMLHEANILRSDCRIINCVPYRPPRNDITTFISAKPSPQQRVAHLDKWLSLEAVYGLHALYDELTRREPKLIIPLGATAFWALTGQSAITKWRGSLVDPGPLDEWRKALREALEFRSTH